MCFITVLPGEACQHTSGTDGVSHIHLCAHSPHSVQRVRLGRHHRRHLERRAHPLLGPRHHSAAARQHLAQQPARPLLGRQAPRPLAPPAPRSLALAAPLQAPLARRPPLVRQAVSVYDIHYGLCNPQGFMPAKFDNRADLINLHQLQRLGAAAGLAAPLRRARGRCRTLRPLTRTRAPPLPAGRNRRCTSTPSAP